MSLNTTETQTILELASKLDQVSQGTIYSESTVQDALKHLKGLQSRLNASVQACENALNGHSYSHHDMQDGSIVLRLMFCDKHRS